MKKILIVLPTYNEEIAVQENTLKVYDFCQKNLIDFDWQILIADNGSTDRTPEIAKELSKDIFLAGRLPTNYEFNRITNKFLFFHIPEKGRGYALKKAWSEHAVTDPSKLQRSGADIYAYMDIDLATNLSYFLPLIKAISEENYDLAIGSRLKIGKKTDRSFSREFLSRVYNILLKFFFQPNFEDAQCGFKAISKKVAEKILPKVKNNNWFFDTELLILAEKAGYKIKEIPVEWVETRAHKIKHYVLGRAHKSHLCALERVAVRKSTVKVLATVWEDIKGMIELKLRLLRNK